MVSKANNGKLLKLLCLEPKKLFISNNCNSKYAYKTKNFKKGELTSTYEPNGESKKVQLLKG